LLFNFRHNSQNRWFTHRFARRSTGSRTISLLIDGTNEVLETVRRKDGAAVCTCGRPGRDAGEFHYVHFGQFDSRGNFYTGAVDTGKCLQKWVPVE